MANCCNQECWRNTLVVINKSFIARELTGRKNEADVLKKCQKWSLVLVQHGFSHIRGKGHVLGSCTLSPTATGHRAYCGSTFTHQLKKVDFDLNMIRPCHITIEHKADQAVGMH